MFFVDIAVVAFQVFLCNWAKVDPFLRCLQSQLPVVWPRNMMPDTRQASRALPKKKTITYQDSIPLMEVPVGLHGVS